MQPAAYVIQTARNSVAKAVVNQNVPMTPQHPLLNRRTLRLIALILLLTAMAINVAAFLHAHAMTTFSQSRDRTKRPEELSFGEKISTLFSGITLPRPANALTPANYLLEYSTTTLPSTNQTQLELWLIPHPAPIATVALFHGYGASKDALLAEAAELHPLGCNVCLVDFRGSGGSSGNYTTIGWEEADDVTAVANHLRSHSPDLPLLLYGQSMGAAAVLKAVAEQPHIADGLILEATYDCLLTTVKNRFAAMHLPPMPFAYLLLFWGSLQHGFNAFAMNPATYATQVSAPTLLLHGALDERATVADAQRVCENLQGEKRLVIFEGVGHQSCLDADNRLWREAVIDFLKNRAPHPPEESQRIGR